MRLTASAGLFVFLALTVGFVGFNTALAADAESDPSAYARLIFWVQQQQRAFHEDLTQGLQAITEGGGLIAGLSLVLASFLYGVFHAAGPGHGKAVLTTYLLTNRALLRRGIGIAVAAAFCQGIVAIILVYGLIWLAGWLPRDTSAAVTWSERLSYVLVFLLGAMLALRAAWRIAGPLLKPAAAHGHSHHEHDYGNCGHSHGPTSEQISQAKDWHTTFGVVLSIGLRPCSGAVVVLIFAHFLGLAWAGIGSVAAMSVGTALAVSVLAIAAVSARDWAISIGPGKAAWGRYLGITLSFAGGLFVMAIGWSLLAASFGPTHPLALS